MKRASRNLLIDFGFILLSIIIAIWLGESAEFERFLSALKNFEIIGSFVAGLFFTSIFTTAPAIVILSEIAQDSSPILVAVVGSFGALLGDLLMFKLLRDRLAKDFYALFHIDMNQRYFRIPRFRWLAYAIAGIIIASPFPDELGIAILGFSNSKTNLVIPISLIFNFIGILIVASIAA
ncbi:MAG: hypothetical protein A3C49_02875 [Candidatus Doudnabacteria bacterium RIFCSPHIGHO2_02_FULL_42_25]|uniref:TVP38/TMEM64 family membrane protein n=1 Tax=Candidatus Doudnabacteria bacterium RIFCSPHIGHO2_01_FULL_41_86 TaxID=1817821 RepID=A0A1F5N9Z0_9BACT|nr:MAG: hypothetical protein A2717_02470 [Candidatus Doudnabacteria bacterium RIFCSPHIGHO2_01_FULL_41_86]OGE75626.1 MAG: hypothetical protein A3K07_02230 [Candidatus Doudnabacteria bacterium RIFCSPHIGHO2_01_43_10]OGE85421.1 MAG: hypothetical protein A3E28_02040 [Candidatus Doudnabacteria bacterium RIFCSPHIGHO2_12_FULL_42_22]OGE86959.1 MAG: hypothetical protein A3C49_02875 [Candidatus Doudnabacteria bacterium RIFCSPHIGHO2_02_FULL_42_25]OGE92558.1 MAG: hypothetical protein A2895_03030 [Candidatus